jgi:hypothetical protein
MGSQKNEDILEKLKMKQVIDYNQNYKRKWKECINRMNTGRIPKQILHYQPREQRTIVSPMKRWEESIRSLQATWPHT